MKRLKILSAAIFLMLGLGWYMIATGPPIISQKIFKYPHWMLRTNYYGMDIREIGSMDFRCFDAQGNLKWEELNRPNSLADEGEYMFLDVALRAGSAPSNYYLRLYNATPTDTSNLTSISTLEPGATYGYAAQTVERSTTGWPTLALDSGDYRATSSTETFTASGGSWGPVTYCVLATSTDSSGKLVSYVALSTSRTLAAGESLQVTYRLKLQ